MLFMLPNYDVSSLFHSFSSLDFVEINLSEGQNRLSIRLWDVSPPGSHEKVLLWSFAGMPFTFGVIGSPRHGFPPPPLSIRPLRRIPHPPGAGSVGPTDRRP